mmetsp:Transcript_38574/g.110327  ORF Transcript_38574/g.110327 Transcript_38574/m.110327 type:complete len:131 (+) Transcript_38574:1765-2157(+)
METHTAYTTHPPLRGSHPSIRRSPLPPSLVPGRAYKFSHTRLHCTTVHCSNEAAPRKATCVSLFVSRLAATEMHDTQHTLTARWPFIDGVVLKGSKDKKQAGSRASRQREYTTAARKADTCIHALARQVR